MRLAWNEIRTRAATFAREWAGEGYEKGQTQLFYRDFFDIFGVPVRRVASFEEPVKNLGDKRGFIDLFWKGVLLVEQKSAGRDLKKAKTQALNYFPGLKDADLPRFILLSDFQTFELYDLDEDEAVAFSLADLPKNVEKLGFILGVQKRSFKDQDPVNIKASELVGRLHDSLETSGYTGHDLEQFLVRIVFCLFADDTGIFEPRGIFLDLLENRTREDGSDVGGWIAQLFQVLNTPEERRATNLDSDLSRFPYVNGDLFKVPLLIPSFDAEMRKRLLDASQFDWSGISPAIFGSLFQSVMDRDERRANGAHYTTEQNIMKVIQPLFMDELNAEFDRLRSRRDSRRRSELQAFHDRLSTLTFFDPACGSGNFLIIAYRELRLLELKLVKELIDYERDEAGQFVGRLLALELSKINVDQFYGIEIGEFAAKIAETALWMMDHIMNNRLSLEFGQTYVRIPLKKSAKIVHGDALETDWNAVIPASVCTYVMGNPPFLGAKYQTAAQRQQVRNVARLGGSGGTLDYVAAWFIKAGDYVQSGSAKIGFVSTNSITQGEQVAQLWPILFDRCHLEIAFAHRTFAWGSEARGRAHVHVVIIGLVKADAAAETKRLFNYADIKGTAVESQHKAIAPYLFDASGLSDHHLVVREAFRPLNNLPPLVIGSKPIDGGYLIMEDEAERQAFLAEGEKGHQAEKYLRPYIGTEEFLNGGDRSILCVQNASPGDLAKLSNVIDRLRKVREYRSGEIPAKKREGRSPKAPGISSLALANTPASFHVTVIPDAPFLVVPKVSSERREYVPIGWLEPPNVASDLLFVGLGISLPAFGILTSAMHMAWLRNIGGRHESRYRYSAGLVYNTFPWPEVSRAKELEIERLAQAVLDARADHPGSTLSDLYDPDLMPLELRKAHVALDKGVDKLYRRAAFKSERERVEYLFGLYESTIVPVVAAARQPRRGRSRAAE